MLVFAVCCAARMISEAPRTSISLNSFVLTKIPLHGTHCAAFGFSALLLRSHQYPSHLFSLLPVSGLVYWLRQSNRTVDPLETLLDVPSQPQVAGVSCEFTVRCRDNLGEPFPHSGGPLQVIFQDAFLEPPAPAPEFSRCKLTIGEGPKLPHPLSHFGAVAIPEEHAVLIIGGSKEAMNANNCQVLCFNIKTGKYGEFPPLVQSYTAGHCGRLKDGVIYTIGNYTGYNRETLQLYDPRSRVWRCVSSFGVGLLPASVVDSQNRLHCIGGGGANHFMTDGRGAAMLTPLPQSLSHHGAAIDAADRIYVFGGTHDGSTAIKSMLIFDPLSGVWIPGPSMPEERCDFAWWSDDKQIVVMGGASRAQLGVEPSFDTIFIYDMKRQQWTIAEEKLPHPMRAGTAAMVDGVIHCFGGITANQRRDYHFTIRPLTQQAPPAIPSEVLADEKQRDKPVESAGRSVSAALESLNVVDNQDGTYRVRYRVLRSGVYSVKVLLNDRPIKESPFFISVPPLDLGCVHLLQPEAAQALLAPSAVPDSVEVDGITFKFGAVEAPRAVETAPFSFAGPLSAAPSVGLAGFGSQGPLCSVGALFFCGSFPSLFFLVLSCLLTISCRSLCFTCRSVIGFCAACIHNAVCVRRSPASRSPQTHATRFLDG